MKIRIGAWGLSTLIVVAAARAEGNHQSVRDSSAHPNSTFPKEAPGDAYVGPYSGKVYADRQGKTRVSGVEQSVAWNSLDQSEKQIASKMLMFWSLANKSETPPQVISDSGLSAGKFEAFRNNLGNRFYLNNGEKKTLREPFTDPQLGSRLKSRSKIVGLVEKLQSDMPEMRNVLTEMLTVWGEARGIKGFTEQDDSLQQAKMASIIHVLRNRTARRMEMLQKKGKNAIDYIEKWKIATARYQFSAFEPYDPNLALIGLGPVKTEKSWSFDTLPRNDQRALLNLAKVIARMNSGQILIPDPLGQKNTRHYLTPTLIRYTRRQENYLRKAWSQNSRFRVLRIPNAIPQFLAVVPNWAVQKKLITEPPIVLQSGGDQPAVEIKIPPKDFVYFWGVL